MEREDAAAHQKDSGQQERNGGSRNPDCGDDSASHEISSRFDATRDPEQQTGVVLRVAPFILRQQQAWPPRRGSTAQQDALSAAVAAYCAGAASNFVWQPREQKWTVSPLQRDEPAACAGSMVMPQMGSMTVVLAGVDVFMCFSFHRG
jgi:hypothetical protein